MGDTDVTVWLNIHRMEALEEQLELEGSSVEKHLQDYLIDLYSEMVSFEEQQRIEDLIAAEQKADEEVREAQRRFSVFRIVENGEEVFLSADGSADMLSTAVTLRAYVKNFPNKPGLQNIIPRSQSITEQQFRAAVEERMDNTGRVVGAYEIDMDKGEFTTLKIMDGWKAFQVKDVCAAASRAMRKDRMLWDDRWERFISSLDGKELTSASMDQEQREELSDPQFGSM